MKLICHIVDINALSLLSQVILQTSVRFSSYDTYIKHFSYDIGTFIQHNVDVQLMEIVGFRRLLPCWAWERMVGHKSKKTCYMNWIVTHSIISRFLVDL